MAVSMIGPKFYAWDRDGKPLAFGKVYTYKARTNAPKVTYTTEDSITANTNPVILNGEGYADIYLTGSYKVVVKDKDGNEIWTADPVSEAAGVGFSYIVTAYYASSSSFNILGDHREAFAIGARVELSFLDALNTETTVTASSFDGTNTVVEVFDTVVRTSITSAGISTGFSSLADFAELSTAQLEEQEEEFQNRFAVVRPAINWTAATLIDNPLQLYSTGTEGVSGYQQWLPDPNQLPFTTENTFPEDQVLNRWTESNTASVDYVDKELYLAKDSFDSLTTAIAFVTANPDTIELLSTASYRNEAECTSLGIDYPDGGGASYVVEALGTPDGYGDHAAGAKQLTLNASSPVSAFKFGMIGNGINGDSEYIRAALTARSDIEITGTPFFDTEVLIPDGSNITGSFNATHGGDYYPLRCSGSSVAITTTTESKVDLFNSVAVDSVSGLSVGDYIRIVSTQTFQDNTAGDWQLDDSGNDGFFAEYMQISDITGTTLTFIGRSTFALYPSGSSVELVNFNEFSMTGTMTATKTADSFEFVRMDYCKDSFVDGLYADSAEYTGPSVTIRDSLQCEGRNISTYLDPSIVINYLGTNPASPDYFEYNALKCISSQSCGWRACILRNGTQNIDFTYSGKPSLHCYAYGNKIYNARHNMMTSHPGSYHNMMIGNIGLACERGPSLRCQRDEFRGNTVEGVGAVPPNVQTNSYGIITSDGFNRGTKIADNEVRGFYRNYYINAGNSTGFDYNPTTLQGGSSADCVEPVRVDSSSPSAYTGINLGVRIDGLDIRDFTGETGIKLSEDNTDGVVISNCIFPDDIGSSNYAVRSYGDNCRKLTVTGCVWPDVGRPVRVGGITDGNSNNTPIGAGLSILSNINRNYTQNDVYVYDGAVLGGLTAIQERADSVTIAESDTSIDVSGHNLIQITNSGPSTAGLLDLTGGSLGQMVTLKNNTAVAITLTDAGGNTSLKTSPFTLTQFAAGTIRLQCVSESSSTAAWVEI